MNSPEDQNEGPEGQNEGPEDQNEGPEGQNEGQNEGPEGQNEGPKGQSESPKTKMKAQKAEDHDRGITGPRFRVLPFYRQIRGIPVWWFAGRSPSRNIAFWIKRHGAQGPLRPKLDTSQATLPRIPPVRGLWQQPQIFRVRATLEMGGNGPSRPGWEFRV